MAVEARRDLAGRNPFPASDVTASVNVQHEIWWNSLSYRSLSPWDAVLQTRGICRDALSGGHLTSVDTYSTPRAVFFSIWSIAVTVQQRPESEPMGACWGCVNELWRRPEAGRIASQMSKATTKSLGVENASYIEKVLRGS